MLSDWHDIRDESIEKISFPFPKYRKGQRKMAVEVYRNIKRKGHLMIQAPTGIGKTMGTIFPSVKTIPEENITKIFYLTARNTGKQISENALIELNKKGLECKFVNITAKEKICFNPGAECTGKECGFAYKYYDKINNALEDLFNNEKFFTKEIITEYGEKYNVCPFEMSLDIALWSDIVICDYNYVFEPRAYLRRFFADEKIKKDTKYILLIDEAHNMPDRAREMFSAQLCKNKILETRRAVGKKRKKIYNALSKINNILLEMKKNSKKNEFAEENKPEIIIDSLKNFIEEAENWLILNQKTLDREILLETYFEISWFLKCLDFYDEHYFTCYEKFKTDFSLTLFCSNPSSRLSEILEKIHSAVVFSATMIPMDYFANLLGFNEDLKKILFPSPFKKENLLVLSADNISTKYKHRELTKEKISVLIDEFLSHRIGNYLIFFPSYKYMNSVYEILDEKEKKYEIVLQVPEMTEPEREDFISKFSADNSKTLAGFAVMGGIFGEGIDLTGEKLSGAAVIGVGLPGLSLKRKLIYEHFEKNGNGFDYAYKFPGINRVLQAAGRVIRTETDKGVILLVGSRYRYSEYKNLLPKEWEIKRSGKSEILHSYLTSFWNE